MTTKSKLLVTGSFALLLSLQPANITLSVTNDGTTFEACLKVELRPGYQIREVEGCLSG